MRLYPEEPDAEIVEVTEVDRQRHTLVGIPQIVRPPAPVGTRYCLLHPPDLDAPIELVLVPIPAAELEYEP